MIGRRTRVAGRKVVPRGRDRYREIVQSLETESKLGNFVHHLIGITPYHYTTMYNAGIARPSIHWKTEFRFPRFHPLLRYNVVTRHLINNRPAYIYDSINDFLIPFSH